MEFAFDPCDEEFRNEVRQYLRDNLPAEISSRISRPYHTDKADVRAWIAILNRRGWAAPGWPKEYGGTGWSLMQQLIFEEECFAASAPTIEAAGLKMIGPIIYTFGNDEQRKRFLEPWLRGEISWAQGFSEPDAGSDLASLRTVAVRDGDEYVINGSKVWTSNAQFASWLFLLVKTNPAEKHRGISLILVDAKSAGITIRPIIDISEGHSLNEVFFDNVRAPVANLVGREGMGWTYAKFLLDRERAFAAEVPRIKTGLRRLKAIAARRVVRTGTLLDDPAFGTRIAQLEADALALEWLTLRALAAQEGDELPFGSILKIRGTELQQKIGEMQVEALGEYGNYIYSEEEYRSGTKVPEVGPELAPGILADFMYRRCVTIYSGSNEIQRNLIARRYLQLPDST